MTHEFRGSNRDKHLHVENTKNLSFPFFISEGFPYGSAGKKQPAIRKTWVGSLGWEDPLEKGKATHSRILAWRIPWTV